MPHSRFSTGSALVWPVPPRRAATHRRSHRRRGQRLPRCARGVTDTPSSPLPVLADTVIVSARLTRPPDRRGPLASCPDHRLPIVLALQTVADALRRHQRRLGIETPANSSRPSSPAWMRLRPTTPSPRTGQCCATRPARPATDWPTRSTTATAGSPPPPSATGFLRHRRPHLRGRPPPRPGAAMNGGGVQAGATFRAESGPFQERFRLHPRSPATGGREAETLSGNPSGNRGRTHAPARLPVRFPVEFPVPPIGAPSGRPTRCCGLRRPEDGASPVTAISVGQRDFMMSSD